MRTMEQGEQVAAVVEAPRFIQFLFYKTDPLWRRLPEEARARGRREFAQVVGQRGDIKTFAYSTLGLKVDADLMLWRIAGSLDYLQEMSSALLQTGLGLYLETTHSLFG